MARTNPFTLAVLIAFCSDNFIPISASSLESLGFDKAAPHVLNACLSEVRRLQTANATLTHELRAAQMAATRLGQELVGWDAQDMAVSAASAVAAPVAPASVPVVTEAMAPATATTPSWLTARRQGPFARIVVGLKISDTEIIRAIDAAIAAGHTANDAFGAWIARNGGGGVTAGKIAAGRAMGFVIA